MSPMKKNFRIWQDLSNGGVRDTHSPEMVKKIRIINQCCIASILAACIYFMVLFILGSANLALLILNIALCATLVFVMVRTAGYVFAAHLMMLTIPLALLLTSWAYGKVGAEYYYFPLVILCYYIFNKQRTMFYYLALMAVLFLLAKYYEATVIPTGKAAVLAKYVYYINVPSSFLIGGIFLAIFVRENQLHEKEMREKNLQLESAVDEVEGRNREVTFLLKELNHRTKNNLQLVSSLMRIQAAKLPDDESKRVLEDAQSRIASIALLHQKLYKSESIDEVRFRDFALDLVGNILGIFEDKSHPVDLQCEVDDITLNIDHAVTLGLILNELLTNSFKHALRDVVDKKIRLSVRASEPHAVEIRFADNGKGMSGVTDDLRASFGAELIHALVLQMKGEMDIVEKEMNQMNLKLQINHAV